MFSFLCSRGPQTHVTFCEHTWPHGHRLSSWRSWFSARFQQPALYLMWSPRRGCSGWGPPATAEASRGGDRGAPLRFVQKHPPGSEWAPLGRQRTPPLCRPGADTQGSLTGCVFRCRCSRPRVVRLGGEGWRRISHPLREEAFLLTESLRGVRCVSAVLIPVTGPILPPLKLVCGSN